MPFTFCHPAIVLPFKYLPKRFFSVPGLIVGSMSPDFEYFLRMRISSTIGHSIHGIFLFDIPISLLFLYLSYNIIADSLISNLPRYFRNRFVFIRNLNWNEYFISEWKVIILSIIIGAATHILWDSFTHKSGYFVIQNSFLSSKILVYNHAIGVYKILQHMSTIIGGVIIILFLFNLREHNDSTINKNSKQYWLSLFLIWIAILSIRILAGATASIGTLIVSAIACGYYALLLIAFLEKKKIRIIDI